MEEEEVEKEKEKEAKKEKMEEEEEEVQQKQQERDPGSSQGRTMTTSLAPAPAYYAGAAHAMCSADGKLVLAFPCRLGPPGRPQKSWEEGGEGGGGPCSVRNGIRLRNSGSPCTDSLNSGTFIGPLNLDAL